MHVASLFHRPWWLIHWVAYILLALSCLCIVRPSKVPFLAEVKVLNASPEDKFRQRASDDSCPCISSWEQKLLISHEISLHFFFFIIIFFFSLYLLFSPSYIYMISALHLSPHIDPSPWSVHLTFHRDISIMLVSSFHWPEFSHECSGESGRAWMAEKTGAVSTGSILLSERCYICDYISQLCLLLNVYHPAKPVLIQGPPKLRRVLQRQAGMDTVGMLWFFFFLFSHTNSSTPHTHSDSPFYID